MTQWQLPQEIVLWIASMAAFLDPRLRHRLRELFIGTLFARGRRTVASWIRAAGVQNDYKAFYYFLSSLGRRIRWVGSSLLTKLTPTMPPGERILLAIDDTPTKRYGEWVEGAGIHHNPTPGPAGEKFLYGHIWVTLAILARHVCWGTIGLPIWALLYVRKKDIGPLHALYGVDFRTKLELAVQLVEWAVAWLKIQGRKIWVVADGAYAKRTFLLGAIKAGVTVVSRLRKDAALKSLPKAKKPGQRGPQATYGTAGIDLAKRAGQEQGWQTATFTLYGEKKTKKFKTFLATYHPAGGVIRVVLVKERKGWVAFFCTDPEATVEQILEAIADRAAIEQVFHDIKEIHGAGEQQLRNYWANVAAFNMTLWLHTMIELWAWEKGEEELSDRTDSPWDDAARRPSHADRRKALRRLCLTNEIPLGDLDDLESKEIEKLWNRLVNLVA